MRADISAGPEQMKLVAIIVCLALMVITLGAVIVASEPQTPVRPYDPYDRPN